MVAHTGLYDALGVKPKATQKELKRAYLKKSLKLHPDKPGGNLEEFKAMKAAYDTLRDPQKRKAYDRYGPDMVRVMQGEMVGPEAVAAMFAQVGTGTRLCVVLVLGVIAGIVVSSPVLVSVRWGIAGPFDLDGAAAEDAWSWLLVCIPLFVFQAGEALALS